MITASHNPAEYNGLKVSRRDAVPVGYGSGLERLEAAAAAGGAAAPRRVRCVRSTSGPTISRTSPASPVGSRR